MSLINDALKRAQRQRASEEAGINPPLPGGSSGRVAKRGKPLSAQSLLLIVVGATVLIVLSVVATVYLVRDTPPPTRPATAVAATPTAPAAQSAPPTIDLGLKRTTNVDPAPSLVVFVPSPAKTESATPSPVEPAPLAPTPVSTGPVTTNQEPPAAAPATPVVAPTIATAAPKISSAATTSAPDERVNLFLDKLHVTGIRSSGTDSKVLMNDRVYRVNDIVDRGLVLRLTHVQPGTLTFVDERGVVYTKNF